MCMQDWRVGRLIRFKAGPEPNAGESITFQPNQQRVAVGAMIGVGAPGVVADTLQVSVDGYPIWDTSEGDIPFLMSIVTHGDMPMRQVTIQSGSGNSPVRAWYLEMPEEYLAAGLEQFISEYAKWNKFG